MQNYVKAKRSYTQYLLPYKSTPSSRPKTAVLSKQAEEKPSEPENVITENHYVFHPGCIPPSRQMFYQVLSSTVDKYWINIIWTPVNKVRERSSHVTALIYTANKKEGKHVVRKQINEEDKNWGKNYPGINTLTFIVSDIQFLQIGPGSTPFWWPLRVEQRSYWAKAYWTGWANQSQVNRFFSVL